MRDVSQNAVMCYERTFFRPNFLISLSRLVSPEVGGGGRTICVKSQCDTMPYCGQE